MNPYRSGEHQRAQNAERRKLFDRDVAGLYLVVWIASIVRICVGLALHQRFGTELTLATLAAVVLPNLARR